MILAVGGRGNQSSRGGGRADLEDTLVPYLMQVITGLSFEVG